MGESDVQRLNVGDSSSDVKVVAVERLSIRSPTHGRPPPSPASLVGVFPGFTTAHD